MKTAQQAAAAWVASQGRATQAYSDGVAGFTGDWAGATVAQESAMLQGVTLAVTQGRWRAGIQAVGTGGWKTKTEAKKANYGVGFAAGALDQAQAIGKIMSALGNIVPNLPARGTFEQNKIRATTMMDALHAQRGQLGAR